MEKNTTVFYYLLGNSLISTITNAFVWFALTFWAFLETESVLVTSFIAGSFALFNMISAFVFGGIVDHYRKHAVMISSSVASLIFYGLGAMVFFATPRETFSNPAAVELWVLIVILMLGSISGRLRDIALVTLVKGLFEKGRDKANGMIGAMNGIGFSVTSVLSGLAIGFYGMDLAIWCALGATVLTILHLLTIKVEEPQIIHTEENTGFFNVRGTLASILVVPGLIALIFFTTFNNFLGGVFMSLMDPYGLSLVSVQTWGIMFAVLSFGFILGGAYIAKYGLGPNPLRKMLIINMITWTTCIFFTIQPSIVLLAIGMLIWMTLVPFIEATEHTVLQAVVPYEKLGRVVGFAQSVESAATPITAFMIGPIAHFIFIPFMTTGRGVELIGDWFGTGMARGIALVFIMAGIIGLIVTLLAFWSRAYKLLSARYSEHASENTELQVASVK